MIADTHAHLYWDSFEPDLDQIIKNSLDSEVNLIINIGTDLETSKKSLEQRIEGINLYSTVGIHPHEGSTLFTYESIHRFIGEIKQLITPSAKIVGIGETGLDYHLSPNPGFNPSDLPLEQIKQNQKKLYLAQINLARELNLPLIIHCRDAWEDIFVPELSGITGLFHSFTGSPKDAEKALELGYYLSFSCIVTYPKNEGLRQIIATTPLEKILTETDCPFLPPQQIRGQRNEPKYVSEVVKVIAQMKDISYEEAAKATYENAKRLFSING